MEWNGTMEWMGSDERRKMCLRFREQPSPGLLVCNNYVSIKEQTLEYAASSIKQISFIRTLCSACVLNFFSFAYVVISRYMCPHDRQVYFFHSRHPSAGKTLVVCTKLMCGVLTFDTAVFELTQWMIGTRHGDVLDELFSFLWYRSCDQFYTALCFLSANRQSLSIATRILVQIQKQ